MSSVLSDQSTGGPAPKYLKGKPSHAVAKTISLDEDEGLDETTSMEAESFLESYEDMIRIQKDEMAVTLRHLEPLLELLESKSSVGNSSGGKAPPFTKEFCYNDLKQALNEIEEDESLRFVASDLQWSLVLKLLTENDVSGEQRISWAEIVMCYRTCIIGMQALDQTPEPKELRTRVRQRSLQMLSCFKGTGLRKPESGVTRNEKRMTAFEWVDALFIFGSLLLLGAVMFSAIERKIEGHTAHSGRTIERFFQTPLVPGPHAMPYSSENMVIPGPHISPHVADSLMIPGPAALPFYLQNANESTVPTMAPLESRRTSAPTSVRELFEGSSENTIPTKQKLQIGDVLQSRVQKSVSKVERRTTKQGLAVVAVAGSTAGVGVLATSLVNTLGTTLPGLVSIGATVVVSTLLAHGIRDWLASLFSKHRKTRQS
jgi:hypothetical protein